MSTSLTSTGGGSSSTSPTLTSVSSSTTFTGSSTDSFATNATSSSSSSTVSPATTSDAGSPSSPPSSTLYLFTFLATLFLLLAISSAIIMRGIFLRRRFRRRLEEAIAAGVLLTPTDDGSGDFGAMAGGSSARRKKMQRPTLFDVSVLPPYFASSSPQDGNWEKVMPFSGSVHAEKPSATDAAPAALDVPQASARRGHRPTLTPAALLERAGYLLPRSRRRRPSTSALPAAPAVPSSGTANANANANTTPRPEDDAPAIPLVPLDPVDRAAEVRVAVVIAMPNPHRTGYVPPAVDAGMHALTPGGKGKARGLDGWGEDGDEEAGVPDVVLGTVRVPVAATGSGKLKDEEERGS